MKKLSNKRITQFSKKIIDIHSEGAEKFGKEWLEINNCIIGAFLEFNELGLDYTDPLVSTILSNIALKVMKFHKEEEY